MEAQRFEAFNMNDAIKLIRKELGKDAVIVSTRELEKKVPGHNKNQKIVEVYAAPSAQKIEKHVFPKMAYPNPATVLKTPPKSPSLSPLAPHHGLPVAPRTPAPVKNDGVGLKLDMSEINAELKKLQLAIQNLPEVRVGDQLEEMKLLMKEMFKDQIVQKIPSQFMDVYAVLSAAGIDEKIIAKMLSHLKSYEATYKNKPFDPLEKAIEFLYKSLKTNHWLENSHQKIMAFVGSSGVGKTTVTAKMTSYFKNMNKKVCVISYNECRLLPSDPLKVFTKILEVPFFEVNDMDELSKLIRKRTDDDYIFVDTSSRTMSNQHEVNEIKSLLSLPFPLELCLVVAAGMRQRDLDSTIRSYKTPFLKSLVFTKIDEYWPFGEMINCSYKHGLSLSYFSNGHRVPEDIVPATKDYILERLFKI